MVWFLAPWGGDVTLMQDGVGGMWGVRAFPHIGTGDLLHSRFTREQPHSRMPHGWWSCIEPCVQSSPMLYESWRVRCLLYLQDGLNSLWLWWRHFFVLCVYWGNV
jgi:hypothetical protein